MLTIKDSPKSSIHTPLNTPGLLSIRSGFIV